MNAWERQWSEFMSDYDFGIAYIKGKYNYVVDSLSRKLRLFSLVPLKVNLRERVLEQLMGHSWYPHVISVLQSSGQHNLIMKGIIKRKMECFDFKGGCISLRKVILETLSSKRPIE